MASEAPLRLLEWMACRSSSWLRPTDGLGGLPLLLRPPLRGGSGPCAHGGPEGGGRAPCVCAAAGPVGVRAGRLGSAFWAGVPKRISGASSFPEGGGCS